MSIPPGAYSPEDVKRFTRRLTLPLARLTPPPTRVRVEVGAGFHLLLTEADGRLLHVTARRAGSAAAPGRAPVQTAQTALYFRGLQPPSVAEQSWQAGLKRGLNQAEREPGWAGFLEWAERQPAVMLPDATWDPTTDAAGNLEVVRVETRCNGRCGFCSARGVLPDLVTDAREIGRRLRAMRQQGRTQVAFSGGEPTLRADLPELVARAAAEGFSEISVQTNAMRLDTPPLAEALARAGATLLFVPLLSHRAAVHDELLGVPGAHARTLAGIDRARSAGLEVTYNVVITRPNLADLAPLLEWLPERFPARRVRGNISYVALQGWAVDHPELVPRLAETRPHLQAALDVCETRGLDFLVPGLCGLPVCVLPGYETWFDEFRRGAPEPPENRRYGAVCARCAAQDRCSGFWSLYLDWFGEDELGYPDGVQPPV